MGGIIFLVILFTVIILVLKNNSPEAKEKREQKMAEEKSKQEAADLLIETSPQAAVVAKTITDALSDPQSKFLEFLRLRGAYIILRVTRERFYFEVGSSDKRISNELNYDEHGNPLPRENRIIQGLTFHDIDWADLPNQYMVNALYSFLMRKIEELPSYTIKSAYDGDRILYTPQKSTW